MISRLSGLGSVKVDCLLRMAFPLDRGDSARILIYRRQEAPHEFARCADCTRRLLRHALLHREGSGKIEGLLRPHSWRESDQGGKSCYIKLANTWIILNSGGGPAPEKPEVLLETVMGHRINMKPMASTSDLYL